MKEGVGINELIPDLKKLMEGKVGADFGDVSHYLEFATAVSNDIVKAIKPYDRGPRDANTVYASELGQTCYRQHWYKVNTPQDSEVLLLPTKIKFLYGNVIEGMVLLLARLAGHNVTDEQLSLERDLKNGVKIRGRIDAIIDGVVVDVKSTSPFGYDKMAGKRDWPDDFGYSRQLDFYQQELHKAGYFLLVDKQNGRIGWSFSRQESLNDINLAATALATIAQEATPDKLSRVATKPHARGKVLDTKCSYCAFKVKCWADANDGKGLKAYKYSTGPVFFADIDKKAGQTAEFKNREIKLLGTSKGVEEEQEESGEAEIPKVQAEPNATV